MTQTSNYEQGSEYHWLSYQKEVDYSAPWAKSDLLFGSGRDALRALVAHGQSKRNWRRLWVPSYFCQDVIAALDGGIAVLAYSDGPLDLSPNFEKIDVRNGDALLVVNFFGLRGKPSFEEIDRNLVEIIEDHTHDPWSNWACTSEADWCIASLRKVLPIPDGGVLWSPLKKPLPSKAPICDEHNLASLEKLAAMILKRLYFEGRFTEKKVFREIASSGEHRISSREVSGIFKWTEDALDSFPIKTWREKRRKNHEVLSSELSGLFGLTLLQSGVVDACPFSGILLFDSPECKNYMKDKLIASRIYPAILWPLGKPLVAGINQEYVDFSERMLSVHCDMRYGEDDMNFLAERIRYSLKEYYTHTISSRLENV